MTPQTTNLMKMCSRWGLEVLGVETILSPKERGLRHAEEAIELAQALGVTKSQMTALVKQVYGKEPGEPTQEVAGSLFTLYVLCDVLSIDPEIALRAELERVSDPEIKAKCVAKQATKVRAVGV
jgi:NTP pyrophosphatase (non-canonical NTP hydrolase)